MGGNTAALAYEERVRAEQRAALEAIIARSEARNPPAPGTPEQKKPDAEEDIDLWTEGPDRPQRIDKRERALTGLFSTPSDMMFGQGPREEISALRPLMTPEAQAESSEEMRELGRSIGQAAKAVVPGWQKMWHDLRALALESAQNHYEKTGQSPSEFLAGLHGGERSASLLIPPVRMSPQDAAEEAAERQRQIQKETIKSVMYELRIKAAMPSTDDVFEEGAAGATFSIGMMLPSLVAGFISKNPTLATSIMSSQSGVSAFAEARRAGKDYDTSLRYAGTMALIEAIAEFLPNKLLIEDLVKNEDFVLAVTKQIFSGGAGEQAATFFGDLATFTQLYPEKPLAEFWAGRLTAAEKTLFVSLISDTLMGGGVNVGGRIINAFKNRKTRPASATETPEQPTPGTQQDSTAEAGADTQSSPPEETKDRIDQIAESVERAELQERSNPTDSVSEDPDETLIRDVEQALGVSRPAPPAETPEQRRARLAERREAERRQVEESTARIVAGVRSFVQARAAAEGAVERAADAPSPETVIEAVAAHNEMARMIDAEPIDLTEEMGLDLSDRSSGLAEAERLAAELEAMGTEDAAFAASLFRTLIRYSDRYDDNAFWSGLEEAVENAAPMLMTPEQQAAVMEKVVQAVEAAPLAPEEEAGARIVEEIRAEAPESKYFGRKSFGGPGLATARPEEAPAPEPTAPEPEPSLTRPAKPLSERTVDRLAEGDFTRANEQNSRETMAEQAEAVYDDILSKPVLEQLNDLYDMDERRVRSLMAQALDGRGNVKIFNQLMKRYNKAKEALAASAPPPPAPANVLTDTPAPEPSNTAAKAARRFVEGETWGSLWKRVQRFAGRDDATRRYDDAAEDAATMIASMSPRAAEEALSDARQLGGPAEKAAVDDIRQRAERIRSQQEVKFARSDAFYENPEGFEDDISEGAAELQEKLLALETALSQTILGSNNTSNVAEPIAVLKEKLAELASNRSAAGRELQQRIYDIEIAIKQAFDKAVAAGNLPAFAQADLETQRQHNIQEADRAGLTGDKRETYLREMDAFANKWAREMNVAASPDAVFDNYGLLDADTPEENAQQFAEVVADLRTKASDLGLADIVAKIDELGPFDQKAIVADINTMLATLATVRRNIDELADEVFARARAEEDVSSPQWQDTLDKLRDFVELFEDEGGLRQYSRPRNVLFSSAQAKAAGLPEDRAARFRRAEKNRKYLDSHAIGLWGDLYGELVRTGRLTYADADDFAEAGYDGLTTRAVTFFDKDGRPVETVLNASVLKPHDMDGIILHEIGIHHGLKGLLGQKAYDAVMADVEAKVASGRFKDRHFVRARLAAMERAARPEDVAEETVAYLVEESRGSPFVWNIVTQIKTFLGRKFPGLIGRLNWGVNEYRQLAIVSLRKVVRELRYVKDVYRPRQSRFMPLRLEVPYTGKTPKPPLFGPMRLMRLLTMLDLRKVDTFADQVRNAEREMFSPEFVNALFEVHGDTFNFPEYQDLINATKQGDPDAAHDLSKLLEPMARMNLPVYVMYSRSGIPDDAPGSPLWEAAVAKGLDMSAEARRARGEAAGFNMGETLYHGTASDIQAFDLDRSGESAGTPGERAVFLSTNPTEASVYARNAAVAKNGPGAFGQGANIRGANVMPVVIRPGRQMVVTTESHPDLKSKDGTVMLYNASRFADIIADARAEGYDTVRFVNVLDSALEPADQIAVLDPKDIRSVNAAFDPDQSQSPNVMFSKGPAPTPPEEISPAGEAIWFNMARVDADMDVREALRDSVQTESVRERMGEPIVLADVKTRAAHADVFEAMVNARKGMVLSMEEKQALRDAHMIAYLKVRELAAQYESDPSDTSVAIALTKARAIYRALAAEVKGQSAEAARTLNVFKIQASGSPRIASALETAIESQVADGSLLDFARFMNRIGEADVWQANKLIEISTWQAWQDLAGTWIRFVYLTALPTHMINALGNMLVIQGSILDYTVAGLARGDQQMLAEAFERQRAFFDALIYQIVYATKNSQLNPLKPNFSLRFDDEGVSGRRTIHEMGDERALSAARMEKLFGVSVDPESPFGRVIEALGYGLSAPTQALGTMDDMFKGVNFHISIRGQALRAAQDAVRRGEITKAEMKAYAERLVEVPTKEMQEEAIRAARELTFTNRPGEWTQFALKARRAINNKTLVLGHIFFPFVTTISHLMSFRLRRWATAPMFDQWRQEIAAGGKSRDVALAQWFNGTAMTGLGFFLFSAGLITGLGPDDWEENKALKETGWRPLAFKDSNGVYHPLNVIDPTLTPVLIGAIAAEVQANDWRLAEDPDLQEMLILSSLRTGKMVSDKTFMTSLGNFVEAVTSNDPNRWEKWLNRTSSGATVPAFFAAMRRSDDEFQRHAVTYIEQVRNRVPELSETLPKKYDIFGRPVVYNQGGMDGMLQFFLPGAWSKGSDEPIDREMLRLQYIPPIADANISVNLPGLAGEPVSVNLEREGLLEAYSDLQRLFGGDEELGIPNYRQMLNDLVTSEGYARLSDIPNPEMDGTKAHAIRTIVSAGRRHVQDVVIYELYPVELQAAARKIRAAQIKIGQMKEAEATQSAVTEAYQQLLEQAK